MSAIPPVTPPATACVPVAPATGPAGVGPVAVNTVPWYELPVVRAAWGFISLVVVDAAYQFWTSYDPSKSINWHEVGGHIGGCLFLATMIRLAAKHNVVSK